MADGKHEEVVESPDIHFEPIVQLPSVEIKSLEEDEEEILKLRAKLFRFDKTLEPPEWKERGTGDVKLLRHRHTELIRLLMRRDKTLKVCANHYVTPQMELKPNCGSDRAWVWSTPNDFADEEPTPELLAIRFANPENAQKFKEKFEEAKKMNTKILENTKPNGVINDSPRGKGSGDEKEDEGKTKDAENGEGAETKSEEKETSSVTDKLGELTVKEENKSESSLKDTETSSTEKTEQSEEKKD